LYNKPIITSNVAHKKCYLMLKEIMNEIPYSAFIAGSLLSMASILTCIGTGAGFTEAPCASKMAPM
jgi:hypothetical protein